MHPLRSETSFDLHGVEYVFVGVADVSGSSKLDADSATMFVCSADDSDITESSVDDVGNVHCQRQDRQNLNKSTLSATSNPTVAFTLADPPYITKVVFLDAAWNRVLL